jgi:threonine synthase
MGEGFTPLIHAANLGIMLGCPNIFIKDERQGPTSSFKDRQAAVSIAALKEAGINEVVLASTGNVAISFSAYAVRAGIKLWAFLTSLVPAEKMREVAIYGTQVVKVTGSYDQAKQVAAEFARQRNLHLESGSRSIPAVEAMKTIAFEIAEQLSEQLGQLPGSPAPTSPGNGSPSAGAATSWRVPDWYFQSVSGGLGPLGVQKGFDELQQMGLTERLPALACIQTEGCAPMAHAWRQNLEVAEPIHSPRTHIATLSTGDPGRTYTLLRSGMLKASQLFPMPAGAIGTGGIIDSVSDEETFRTIHILAKMEGISVEPASAVAFAGLIKLVRAGVIQPSDTVVVNCTGHTIAVERTVLGQGWARNVILPSQGRMDTPQEGLLAALSRVTEDRFPRVAIVDDTEPSRRLIRRILQSQGNYTLFEASNGLEAIQLARRELPDLIILDLMMPELDGFAVLDELKADPETAPIPVIVVTAKELTPDEKKRLEGQIHSLMQKGEFMNDDLLDEVRSLVN